MARITFITPAGESRTVEASDGSLMQAAVRHGVSGIDADCGGVCSCATCHVQIPAEWSDRVGRAGSVEQTLLELEDTASPQSRLACQIRIGEHLDGLVVRVVGR